MTMCTEAFGILESICIGLIFIVGLPHGAIDGVLAYSVRIETRKKYFLFLLAYQAGAICVVSIWYFFPLISLILFLALTVFHFGSCDWLHYNNLSNKFLVIFTHGMIVIFGIIFFNEKQSLNIFGLLSGRDLSSFGVMLVPGYIATALRQYLCFKSIRQAYLRHRGTELSGLCECYFFSAFVAFTFILLYPQRNIPNKYLLLDKQDIAYLKAFFSAVVFTVLCWVLAYLTFIELSYDISFEDSIIKVMFIGLASLTLPHDTSRIFSSKNLIRARTET